ncbi:hypothetical protein [Streptomyces sp. NPDC059994]|uniref:hypothetical protein n=1 Tax=Streptomyces sp. NPDC059994 TaxID=3347029 RepID=UPI00369526A0
MFIVFVVLIVVVVLIALAGFSAFIVVSVFTVVVGFVRFDMVGFLFRSVVPFSFTGTTLPRAAHDLLTVHARARMGHARAGTGRALA